MSFGVSINGHGVPNDVVKEAFGEVVRKLRAAGVEDLSASAWGTEGAESFSISAADVTDDPATPGEDDPNVREEHVTTEDQR